MPFFKTERANSLRFYIKSVLIVLLVLGLNIFVVGRNLTARRDRGDSFLSILSSISSLKNNIGALVGWQTISFQSSDKKTEYLARRKVQELLSKLYQEEVILEQSVVIEDFQENVLQIKKLLDLLKDRIDVANRKNIKSNIDDEYELQFRSNYQMIDLLLNKLERDFVSRGIELNEQRYFEVAAYFSIEVALLMIAIIMLIVSTNKLHNVERQVRAMRNYLDNIINSMPSILIGVDRKRKVQLWNNAAVIETGLSAEDAHNKRVETVFPRIHDFYDKVISSINEGYVNKDLKHPYQKNEKARFEDITIYPLLENEVKGAVVIISDITEKVAMEKRIIQTEKMMSVGGLAAGMAHEINNPLAGMMQTTDVLRRRLLDNLPANKTTAGELGISFDDISEYMRRRDIPVMLDNIMDSGSNAAEIVRNMLSFVRQTDDQKSSQEMSHILNRSIELFQTEYHVDTQSDFRQIEIVKEFEEGVPPVNCDAVNIQQVIMNILRNGAQAMHSVQDKSGPKRFVIGLSDFSSSGYVRITIKDNGPGMKEEVLHRIFEPFFTTKSMGKGTGLGLSISYFIITENHGGKLNAESTPGVGTKFIIDLPV